MPSRKGAARVPADAPADGAALLSAFASMMSGSGNPLPDFVSTGLPSARHVSALREAVEVMLRRATAGKSPTAHIERARALKAEGNEKFLAGDYRAALAAHHASYLWASGFAEWGGGPRVPEAHESFWTAMMPRLCAPASADELQQLRELQAAHHANLALCHMKLQQHERARDDCTRCLAIQPSHVKALLRRALCHASLDAIDDAHDDLEAVLAAQPHNSEALAKMAEIKPRLAQREKETKKRFQKLFKPEKTAAVKSAAAIPNAAVASDFSLHNLWAVGWENTLNTERFFDII